MAGFVGWKLILASLLLTALLALGYRVGDLLLPWIFPPDKVSEMVKFLFAVLTMTAVVVVLYMRSFAIKEWEDEIVSEMTVHQEVVTFRVGFLIGVTLLYGVGLLWKFTWLFHAGFVVGGIFIWLYLVDVILELVHGEEVVAEILSEPEHALRMLGSGVALLLLTTACSLWFFEGVTRPTLKEPPAVEKEESQFQKAWGYVKKGWENVKKSWESKPPTDKEKPPADKEKSSQAPGGKIFFG